MPDNTIEWGQGAVNNTNNWGKAKTNNTIDFGAIYDDSPSGDTNLTGSSGFTNTKSIAFDGVDDYVNVGNPTALQFTSDFSITGWLKCTGSTYKRVVSKEDGTNRSYFVQVQNTGEIAAGVFTGGTNQVNISSVTVNDGNWHFFAFIFEQGTGTKIYVDNNSPSEDLFGGSIDNDPADFEIGRKGNNTNFFIGHIDEVAVWNTALSSSNVTSIYNSGTPTDLSSYSSLVSWYRMGDGDTFPTISDNKGSNDGTMTNMTSSDIETDVPS